MLRTCNNTDGNKLVIFSGIALYYGDTYIAILSKLFSSPNMPLPKGGSDKCGCTVCTCVLVCRVVSFPDQFRYVYSLEKACKALAGVG